MATVANSIAHPTLISVDAIHIFISQCRLIASPAREQKNLHNCWHPDIPAVATVKPGQVFNVECVDWTGAQIGNNDTSDDIRDVDLTSVHNLSGPIAVEGAEPGDCLVVDILDDMGWSDAAASGGACGKIRGDGRGLSMFSLYTLDMSSD
ncbi:Acetamidase/Formamidase family-domain-containing protein [Suillus fuscotomentosus]|uniref:Acetamidase/Formamidase family-domain-containing protein n=1 Tax=Suillus fuscotomentosus TaxID=1912939 RepID=A0AAD4HHR3_9AGAM|nr:Acetamidase/Formamidase family-domain-containing protein [Suillus fuscotomentosus]KAG1895934.1 Acetamidase/Formamidase family-domain-containing protein [Suillus fuscotomentosus]